MLKDDKIILQPIEKDDIELFLGWFNDPEIIQYLQFFLPLTRQTEEKWLEESAFDKSTVVFTVQERREDGDDVLWGKKFGNIGLHQISWKDQTATLGIAIGEKTCQGKGYGARAVSLILKYAFEQLNLLRIESHVYAFNEKSIGLHKKAGFTLEGTRRKTVFKNGQHHDAHIFGLLKKEWLKNQQQFKKGEKQGVKK